MYTLPFILLSVIINTVAQLLLKLGMDRIGEFHLSIPTLWPLFLKIAFSPFILIGIVCYVASLASWLVVLSRADVSYAYPMSSLAYILTALAGYYCFSENLSMMRIVGILVIMLGVYLMSRA